MLDEADLLLDLTRRYGEPHRAYHTLRHVADMLLRGRELALDDEQVLAVWFHDAVYDVRRGDNEERSAALAVDRLRAAGRSAASIAKVERIVLDTARHEPTIEASAPVLDLDLATLAEPWEVFRANTRLLREELAHLDDDAFVAREAVLFDRLLARERIYFTPWGARLEERARRNLERARGPG